MTGRDGPERRAAPFAYARGVFGGLVLGAILSIVVFGTILAVSHWPAEVETTAAAPARQTVAW